ncbi:MAG: response regulator [Deltaproteobacteria bacterium]|nr:response regulator [Deltaproteobacteria bacterium]
MHPRVLVLEDDASTLHAWGRTAEALGIETLLCSTAEEALAALDAGGITAVVSDFQLATGTSLPVILAARRLDPPLPVVAVTGNPELALSECRSHGVDVPVLQKGVRMIDVLTSLVAK